MLRKFLLFGFGLGLGTLMVYFFFGDRDIECSYFPNDRVLYDLRKKEIQIKQNLDPADTIGLRDALERGQVDFEKSSAQAEGCKQYYLGLEDRARFFVIENCDSVATVIEAGAL